MDTQKEKFVAVASKCGQYTKKKEGRHCCSNADTCDCPSCTNCIHFAEERYCDIDLYDQIVTTL